MAKKINIVGTQPKRIRVVDEPSRRIEPAELASALGAEPAGERIGANLDPITLAEIGTELLRRLRSSGGRPALADATEFCRVPLSVEDVRALEGIIDRIEESTGTRPSPGQVVSIIIHDYLTTGSGMSHEAAVVATREEKVNEHIDLIKAWSPRLADLVGEVSSLQKRAAAIETAANVIKEDIDRSVAEVLAVGPRPK